MMLKGVDKAELIAIDPNQFSLSTQSGYINLDF